MEDVRHSYSINRICIQFISFRLLNYDKKIEKITTATTSATAIRLIVFVFNSVHFISFIKLRRKYRKDYYLYYIILQTTKALLKSQAQGTSLCTTVKWEEWLSMRGSGPTGHILSRIYNCTKHGNLPMDSATTAHFTLHILILQLLKLWSTAR